MQTLFVHKLSTANLISMLQKKMATLKFHLFHKPKFLFGGQILIGCHEIAFVLEDKIISIFSTSVGLNLKKIELKSDTFKVKRRG